MTDTPMRVHVYDEGARLRRTPMKDTPMTDNPMTDTLIRDTPMSDTPMGCTPEMYVLCEIYGCKGRIQLNTRSISRPKRASEV
jgi:hypothetical protein